MFQTATVSLSGSVLSYLLYEINKTSLQYGFLLGEIVHKEIISITDRDQKHVDVSKVIKINSVIPWPNCSDFSKGKVDKEKIAAFLGSNMSKVVAWYIYRSYTFRSLTLRDCILHKQFQELFDIPADLFSLCVVQMDCSHKLNYYSYYQRFYRILNGEIDKVKIAIPNLGECNKTYINSDESSTVLNKIISDIQSDVENTKGIVVVTEIEDAIQRFIYNTVKELAKAEDTLFQLEKDVKRLQMTKEC